MNDNDNNNGDFGDGDNACENSAHDDWFQYHMNQRSKCGFSSYKLIFM